MSITHNDVRRILEILDRTSHLDYVNVRIGGTTLIASKSGVLPQSAMQNAMQSIAATPLPPVGGDSRPAAAAPAAEVPEGMVAIRAPMMGTFYCKPSPDQPPFVVEGAAVEAGAPLCLLEAMKLFNTLASPANGRVVRIVAQDMQIVQRDQLLMIIDPQVRG